MSFRQRDSQQGRYGYGGFRVYVGDIGSKILRSDLEKEFGQYGPVTDVWMGRKREAGMPSFAFIVYRYPEDAEEAVRDKHGRKVCGRSVRVEHAKPFSGPRDNNRSDGYRGRGYGRGGGYGGGGGRGGYDGWSGPSREMSRRGRSRSRSAERYRRSPSPAHQNSSSGGRYHHSPVMDRRRTISDSYVEAMPPQKSFRRQSVSPDSPRRHKKKSKPVVSASPSPPPQRKSKKQTATSDSSSSSESRSPSPLPKKKKKKKQRSRSSSNSPPPVKDGYDAKSYRVASSSSSHKNLKKAKSSKSKSKKRREQSNSGSSSSSG